MCFPVDRVRVTVSVREHRFAFLLTSLDFQKRNCEVKVVTVFKIATLRAKSLSRKVTPLARPQAPVSRSLCVHTAGCYRFSKIPANQMGERQVTVVRFSSSVAHHVKRSVSVFPYAKAQLYSCPRVGLDFLASGLPGSGGRQPSTAGAAAPALAPRRIVTRGNARSAR